MALAEVVLLLLVTASYYGVTSASSLHRSGQASLDVRADSPGDSYSPQIVTCPSTRPTIRSAASGLSQSEQDFLDKRRAATVQPMADFFSRADIAGFDASSYINDHQDDVTSLPNIAIAVSGGGYRALLNGAGFLAAADNRTAGSTGQGGIGGLLQATTYVAGLSGGSWLLGSLYANNYSSVEQMLGNDKVWQFQNNIFLGPVWGGVGAFDTIEYWTDISGQVSGKGGRGFQTSVTDYWGRTLSYQLIDALDGGVSHTWDTVAQIQDLVDGNIPMPILVADGRDPGTRIVSLNATNFEIGPWEIGTFDPTVFGFVPTKYAGSNFSAGTLADNENCVEGFSQSGFVMGTSSSLFNEILTANISQYADVPSFIAASISALQNELGSGNDDIAQWVPNPFKGFNPSTNPTASSDQLHLVDGGEDLQNIPFNPLLPPQRAIDVIFAVDSSADTELNWPNGTALRASYERSLAPFGNGTLFPPVPDDHTFINLGLNNRPTFFGCDADNFTLTGSQSVPPLVVYVPNAPYSTTSNTSTFDLSYARTERNDMVTNGVHAGSQGNGTLDARWPACVACAALSRSLARTGTDVPTACSDCFDRYCWNGTLDTADRGPYVPTLKMGNQSSSSAGTGTTSGGGDSGSGAGAGRALEAQAVWKVVVGISSVVALCVAV